MTQWSSTSTPVIALHVNTVETNTSDKTLLYVFKIRKTKRENGIRSQGEATSKAQLR